MTKQEQILAVLDAIERTNGIEIILAIESGSRAWGFESPNSDYDVRFIYKGTVQRYVRVDPLRDVIELPISDDLDINGWDISKALTLFRKSNPPLLEWLQSPIVYRERGQFASKLRGLAGRHYSLRRLAYHYLSMAKQNFFTSISGRNEVARKKYLYVLRPLAAIYWLRDHRTPPPTSMQATLTGVRFPPEIGVRLDAILAEKRLGAETQAGPADPHLNAFIAGELDKGMNYLDGLDDPDMDVELLNRLLWGELGINGAV